jgi:hypothetical protein
MVSVLASSAVDGGFDLWSGQTKDYKIRICCYSAQLQGVRGNSCWIGLSRDNVFEWSDMSTRRLLFQWVSYHHKDDPIKHDGLV